MKRRLKAVMREVPLISIDRPEAGVRLQIDREKIEELAHSIEQQGLLQAIVLRPKGDRFEIVAGDRRYLAHEFLGLDKIRASIVEMSDLECALARATENLTRADLSPLEEAAIYKDLMDSRGLTAAQIGEKMGKTGGTVLRRLSILRMPDALQKAIHAKKISVSAGEELARIKDVSALEYYLECAVEHGATKDVCRMWAKDWEDVQRRKQHAGGGSAPPLATFESKPIYVTCETCHGAMELGKEVVLRICAECATVIKKALEGAQKKLSGGG